MYQPRKVNEVKDFARQRLVLTIEFVDDANQLPTFQKPFEFNITATATEQKLRIKAYVDEINTTTESIPEGNVDLTGIGVTPEEPVEPTAEELAEREWREDWGKLIFVNELIAAGVLTGSENAVTTLRNKVRTGFKASYL